MNLLPGLFLASKKNFIKIIHAFKVPQSKPILGFKLGQNLDPLSEVRTSNPDVQFKTSNTIQELRLVPYRFHVWGFSHFYPNLGHFFTYFRGYH